MHWIQRNTLKLLIITAGFIISESMMFAKSFRVGMIPNGNVNRCSTCHVRPNGGRPLNVFGDAVEAITGKTNRPFWDAALAALDSDGDGVTNGMELADPQGTGSSIQDTQITNPGDPNSVPDIVDPEPEPEPEPVSTTLHIAANGRNLTLTWEEGGVLESSESPQGPWVAVDGATSPHEVVADGAMNFYRVGDGSGGQTLTLRLAPTSGVSSGGSGSGTVSIDGNQLSIHVHYKGLSADFTAAHIHGPAEIGGNAGVLFAVDGDDMHQADGARAGSFIGSGEVSDATIEALKAGKAYLNIHSSANPGGEIRAQILP